MTTRTTTDPGGGRSSRGDLLAHAALLVLALALHGRFLGGEAMLGWDQTAVGTPWARPVAVWNPLLDDTVFWEAAHTLHHVRRGAEWNPYSALGEPEGTFTHPLHGYPPATAAFALLDPWTAKGWLSLLHVALGGAAMLRYLRWRGAPARAALVGAVAYQLSTEVSVWLEYSQRAALVGWAPLIVWGAEATVRTLRPRAAALTALAVAGALLGGFTEQAGVFACVAGALVALVRARPGRRLHGWALAAAAFGLGAGLAAPRLLPMTAEVLDGSRGDASWSTYFDTTCRLGPRHLLTLLAPDVLGNPVRGLDLLRVPGQGWANYSEIRLYFGLPALLLAALGATAIGARWVAVVVLVTVLLAFPTPLTYVPFVLVPGFSASGAVRVVWVAHLFLPLLVAAGAERLIRATSAPRRALALALTLFGLVLVIGLVVSTPRGAGLLVPDEWGASAEKHREMGEVLARRLSLTSADASVVALRAEGRAGWVFSPTLGPLLLAGATLVAVTVASTANPTRRRLGVTLLFGLLSLELLDRGIMYNTTAPPAGLFPSTPGIERAAEVAGADRVAVDGLKPNVLLPFGVRDVGGYRAMHPARVKALYTTIATPRAFASVLGPADASPAWRDALAVRAVLTPPGRRPTPAEGLVLDRAGADVDVWRNPTALARARLHAPGGVVVRGDQAGALEVVRAAWFDPRRHVVLEQAVGPTTPGGEDVGDVGDLATVPDAEPLRLVVDESERVVVEVNAPRGGTLVLADAWTRGWSARSSAGPLELVPADVALRGVVLAPGFQGPVTFVYEVPGRAAGRALALLSLGGLLLLAWVGRRLGPGAPSPPGAAPTPPVTGARSA